MMNVLSLFDGMSCAQIALNRVGIKYDKYYASEIDKHAIKVTKTNFPDTIHLGSVVDVDVSKLDPIHLILGGSPCFLAGTKVICQDSIKNIEDIAAGDYVLTHMNRFRKVLKIGNTVNETVHVKTQGIINTVTTPEHPYYVRHMYRKWVNERRTSVRAFSDPLWTEVKNIKKGDFVGVNIIDLNENKHNLTEEECYILGRYIADGHTRKDYRKSEGRPNDRHWQLILSIGSSKVDSFIKNIKTYNYSNYEHTTSVSRVVFSSKRLVEIAELCGSGAINKKIPMFLISLPIHLLKILIDGYLEGDGHKSGVDKYSLSTISSELVMTISLAIAKVYRVGIQHTYFERPKKHIIEGRIVNQHNTHVVTFSKEVKKQANYKVIDNIIWYPVKKVTTHGVQEVVYNLEVEEDNSYTANTVIVHNCQSFSFAGHMKGMSTKCDTEILTLDHYLELKSAGYEFEGQSYLFWEYMRILADIRKYNPDVKFLLENVMMEERWERILTKAIGINPIVINSALVSAQNRLRNYWSNFNLISEGLFGEVRSFIPQPKDKGIVLKDILESSVDEKYFLSKEALARIFRKNYPAPQFEPEKTGTLNTGNNSAKLCFDSGTTLVGGTIDRDKFREIGQKSLCLDSSYHKGRDNHGASPMIKHTENYFQYDLNGLGNASQDQRAYYPDLESGSLDTGCASKQKVLVRQLNDSKESGGKQPYQQNRVYDQERLFPALTTLERNNIQTEQSIRRLTPTECCRLQTVSDSYFHHNGELIVSDTQIYRMLGNGWTISVIAHIMQYLK